MTDVAKPRYCKDCLAAVGGDPALLRRPLRPLVPGKPGPRCTTHYRLEKKRIRAANHVRHVTNNYEISGEEYAEVKESQGGKCYICRRATGATKALAVDHDHELAKLHDHPVERGCRECIRALLCGPCNQLVGRFKVEALLRAIEVLTQAPARKVLLRKILEVTDDWGD